MCAQDHKQPIHWMLERVALSVKWMETFTWTSLHTFACINIVFIATTIPTSNTLCNTWSEQAICSQCSYTQFIFSFDVISTARSKNASGSSFIAAALEYFHHISINGVIEISLFSLFTEVLHMNCSRAFFSFIASEIELCSWFIYMIDYYYLIFLDWK